ncbi:MAG: zinc metallopeptidase [Candidatus Cloacimonas sp.]|nr:zinc metallopeptidase [Candidatus Cloacimonadota bacterium]
MFYYDSTMLLIIPVLILAFYAQSKVHGNYKKYSKKQNLANLTGGEIAREILDRKGLTDVNIYPIKGVLTDHYNPAKKTVNLSEDVYYGRSISSSSIAAHEVGHAIQHATKYYPLVLRTGILPIAQLGSSAAFPLFLLGLLFSIPIMMDLGIIFFAGALLFHVVTLPVEYNASRRAMVELNQGILVSQEEISGAKAVLNAAALTYVASTLMALMQLIRLVLIRGSRK